MSRRPTPEFTRNRKIVLEGNPMCYWCKRVPASDADHLTPYDAGGSDDISNLVPACKSCNSKRGAAYVNNKRAIQQQRRNEALGLTNVNTNAKTFFVNEKPKPPTLLSDISNETKPVQDGSDGLRLVQSNFGMDSPRLESFLVGGTSFGPQIADWSERNLGRPLFPWQIHSLTGAFSHDEQLRFTHSKALVSAARQNGKTTMNAAIVGWALSELPRIWGRPVRIMSSAHELALATEVFEELRETFELWEEQELCKVTWAYGRHQVKMADGSVYAVKAATGKKHGGTWDIMLLDEIWALSESAIFGALLPSQIAVPSPMCWMTSTAGDESSRAMLKFREQALAAIDANVQTDLYFAEWSLPTGVDPLDPQFWGYPNPSLGRTITVKGLQSAAAAPDRNQFLRAHCNLWVAATSSWLPMGMWAKAKAENLTWDGTKSVLAVDSAVDDSKYVGVWARLNTSGEVLVSVRFSTDSINDLWEKIVAALENDPKLTLAITPSLAVHTPQKYMHRKQEWGYGELLKYTAICRSLIAEGKVKHDGGEMLAEHVARAVLVRAQNTLVVSSQRSPGPIEACRCLITAAVMVSRPRSTAKIGFASS
jgi:hypothetical protein